MIAIACVVAFSPITQAQDNTTKLTDPQIAGIVVAANEIDINWAKMALSKSKNKEVRGFAEQMVRDHSTLLKSVEDLATKLNVTPASSDMGNSIGAQSKETTTKLEALKGKAFNKAYIDNEIAFHKEVIDATNSTLIPDAQNEELKGALENAVPLFQGHLEHAENVAAELGKGKK
ncbi:MAG: DUF4142 domain-containing protein [Acidobacteriaceae bacterium]